MSTKVSALPDVPPCNHCNANQVGMNQVGVFFHQKSCFTSALKLPPQDDDGDLSGGVRDGRRRHRQRGAAVQAARGARRQERDPAHRHRQEEQDHCRWVRFPKACFKRLD